MVFSGLAALVPAASAHDGQGISPMAGTKRVVLGELFTGAWCGFCPYAVTGLHSMEQTYEQDEFVILSYHGSDQLSTTDGDARITYYNIAGYPTVWFDGKVEEAGGDNGCYGRYNNIYKNRAAIASSLRMTVEGDISDSTGLGEIWVNMTAVQTPTQTNLVLHTIVFEDDYGPYNGGNGENYHDWVVRQMMEGSAGTSLTITNGQEKTYHYNIDTTGYAQDYDQIGVIAFVQSSSSKEVVQAAYINEPVLPNVPPIIMGGAVDKTVATEDDQVTFQVFYRDTDDTKNKGPSVKKLILQNGTATPVEKDLTAVSSADPWTVGKWLSWTGKLTPGEWGFRFNASDGEDFAAGADTVWNATKVLIKPRNKAPQLMSPNYAPADGDTATKFRFDIMYRDLDNQEPATAKIFIDDDTLGKTMKTDSLTGPFNDWVTYYYETTMSVGDTHKFYYTFSDGIDSVRFPVATASPNYLHGPEVLPPNNAPTLTTELFAPATGTRQTDYTCSVIYTDGENDRPVVSTVVIDGAAQLMMGSGATFTSGVRYTFSTRLGMGAHSYYFVFNDGKHELRYPAAGVFEGPAVTNLAPKAVIASPEGGTRFTPSDYVPFSAVGSSDPEKDALTYKWSSDLDGDLGTQDAFDSKLSTGHHTITLTVTDAYASTATATIELDVRPYLPNAFVSEVRTSVDAPIVKDIVRITAVVGNDGEARADALEVRILVDGTEVGTDTVSVDVGGTREVSCTWTSIAGDHTIRAEAAASSKEVSLTVLPNALPALNPIIYTPTGEALKYKPGDSISFKAQATDGNSDKLTYEWDFGDGTMASTERDPVHTYTAAGTYSVKLTVTDARGGSSYQNIQVVVEKAPAKKSPGFGGALAALAVASALVAVASRRRRL
jgi:PKD repeat protein